MFASNVQRKCCEFLKAIIMKTALMCVLNHTYSQYIQRLGQTEKNKQSTTERIREISGWGSTKDLKRSQVSSVKRSFIVITGDKLTF